MHLQIFFQTFYLVFLILISVGPGFLTIANIAMVRGHKTSAVAVCGCFLGDCILITLGVFFAQKAITVIPNSLLTILSFVAVGFLYYLAVKFIKTNISKISMQQLDGKSGSSLAITLFCLKMSSPICIIGYSIMFTQIIKVSTASLSTGLSACLGGYLASIAVNAIMVMVFGTIGRTINIKALIAINKLSALFIIAFATLILFTSIKGLI